MKSLTFATALLSISLTSLVASSAPNNPNGNGNGNGNGAPNGAHYTLNLHAVPPTHPQVGVGNGHRMFVKSMGKTRIILGPGDDFHVSDPNGQDGVARLTLPNPDPDGDGVTAYSVFVRALGGPGNGWIGAGSTVTGPGADGMLGTEDDEELVITNTVVHVVTRSNGRPKFKNATNELMYVWADIDLDGTPDRVPLFSSAFENYFWDFDSTGAKKVQLRFYPIPTDTITTN